MNANRNNNRRRGRNNNRGPGGGNQSNRIDSRARGNAPQLLEKFRKLAHDASLNGDRVQTEYYLQFADHYFRVVADSRGQKDETRGRRDERDQADDDGEQEDEFELPGRSNPRRSRQDEREEPGEPSETGESPENGERGEDGGLPTEDEPNPFVRESRARRPRAKPRESAKAKNTSRDASDEDASGKNASGKGASDEDASGEALAPVKKSSPGKKSPTGEDGFDPGVLPPSITREEATEAPRPARRGRRPRSSEDKGGEALEVAG